MLKLPPALSFKMFSFFSTPTQIFSSVALASNVTRRPYVVFPSVQYKCFRLSMSAALEGNLAELAVLVERLVYENRYLLESQSWNTLHVQILKDKILRLERGRRRVRFSNKVTVFFIQDILQYIPLTCYLLRLCSVSQSVGPGYMWIVNIYYEAAVSC